MGDDWDEFDDEFSAETLAREAEAGVAIGRQTRSEIRALRQFLKTVSERICAEYCIPEHQQDHLQLCYIVLSASGKPSLVTFGAAPRVPRGMPTAAATRANFERCVELMDRIRSDAFELADLLFLNAMENPVGNAAFCEAGWAVPDQVEKQGAGLDFVYELPSEIQNRMRGTRELVLESARMLRGRPARPENPDWHLRAAQICAAWWRPRWDTVEARFKRVSSEKPRTKTEPKPTSHFAEWFCDLMTSLFEISVAECKTALDKLQ